MDDLRSYLVLAAEESSETLADTVFRILAANVGAPTNEPLAAEVARTLTSIGTPPVPTRLRAALAHGANTWLVPLAHDTLSAGIALLFNACPSPSLSVSLARRLLRDADPESGLSVKSRHVDLLLRSVVSQAIEPTVRNRCIEIMHDDRFGRFVISMFISLVKIDTALVPLAAGRVFARAADAPHISGRPGYMIAFDRELNLSDVDSIINALEPTGIASFAEHFLSFSHRFTRTSFGVSENALINQTDVFKDSNDQMLILKDRDGGTIRPLSQAAMVNGLIAGLRKNKKNYIARLAHLGLQSRSMLQWEST